MSKIKINYNNEKISDLYYYDATSPSGLRHRTNNKTNNYLNKRYIGDPAGSIRKNANSVVWIVKIDGIAYVAHRIVWVLVHGTIDDDKIIDHIDGNPLNNSIDNLRLTTQTVNNRNHAKQSNNTSGITGVRLEGNRWRVQWNDQNTGIQKSKSFNISKYGDNALKMATDFRDKIIKDDYSKRHGK